jgi:hypothetical protein
MIANCRSFVTIRLPRFTMPIELLSVYCGVSPQMYMKASVATARAQRESIRCYDLLAMLLSANC